MKKYLFLLVLISSFSAYAESFKLICTSKVRFYCADGVGCKVNYDPEPSQYKISYVNRKISIEKYIGTSNTSSWNATNVKSSNDTDKYAFLEDGITTLFHLTNDKRKFVYTYESGMTSYNMSLSLNKKLPDDLGAQIEKGNCIPNKL